jgi:hypothetical protein
VTTGLWDWWQNDDFSGLPQQTLEFMKDGKCKTSLPATGAGGWKWEVVNPTQMKISVGETYWTFDMNLEKKEGKVNWDASTNKNIRCLRFESTSK